VLAHLTRLAALTIALVLIPATPAAAEEKFLGTITRIEMAGPTATVAVATLEDDRGKTVVLTVIDKVTLDKLKDKRIAVGDQIKAKYQVKDGQNVATFFKKPGGC